MDTQNFASPLNNYAKIPSMEIQTLQFNDFPELLKEIPDAPDVVYFSGKIPPDDSIFLGVVGTRKFSTYGKEVCQRIIRGLANHNKNIVIVSGLALGIDAIAHQAAIDNGLKTIAVPGSGVDFSVLHPRSNHDLARNIVERGGCLLSEYEPEFPAGVHTFPRRNRIIAGLSHGTLVIEAPEKSGALITAHLSIDSNREVFAVPGSIFTENAKGTNSLIKMGAVPVTCAEDILKIFDLPLEGENFQLDLKKAELSAIEQKIVEGLREPMGKDELIRALGLPAPQVTPTLTMMMLKGIVKEIDGEVCLSG
jgi:DNA processing protein